MRLRVLVEIILRCLTSYLPLPKIVIKVRGLKLKISFSLLFYYLKGYEPFTTELLENSIKLNHIVLDIGASIGHFSVISGKKAKNGKVYAFEPSPTDFGLLKENVKLNRLTNVYPFQKAVANKKGFMELYYFKVAGWSSMYKHSILPNKKLKVECIRIDDFLKDRKVDLIKMDIEGGEPQALEGMTRTVRSNDNLVLFTELPSKSPRPFISRLRQLGFKVAVIDEKKRITRDFEDNDLKVKTNLYCIKSS